MLRRSLPSSPFEVLTEREANPFEAKRSPSPAGLDLPVPPFPLFFIFDPFLVLFLPISLSTSPYPISYEQLCISSPPPDLFHRGFLVCAVYVRDSPPLPFPLQNRIFSCEPFPPLQFILSGAALHRSKEDDIYFTGDSLSLACWQIRFPHFPSSMLHFFILNFQFYRLECTLAFTTLFPHSDSRFPPNPKILRFCCLSALAPSLFFLLFPFFFEVCRVRRLPFSYSWYLQ